VRPGAAGSVRAASGATIVRSRVSALVAAALAAGWLTPRASLAAGDLPLHAGVTPTFAQLGERLTYRGWIAVEPGTVVQWRAPGAPGESGSGNFTWGPLRSGRAPLTLRHGRGTVFPADSVWVELPLQVFETGQTSVPGVHFVLQARDGSVRDGNLPTVRLGITSMISAQNQGSPLRPPRGPISAPWWERVPWTWVATALLAIAGVLILWLFFRRRKPVAAPVVAAPVRRRDPTAEALAELAALRRLGLPERGQFDDHAFRLGRILRRFVEATLGLPRPGDTTPELLTHLQLAGLSPDDLARLSTLLRRWDGIKFARLESSVEEAARCEDAVRDLVLKRGAPTGKAA
jgi:hypothetical protein